VRLCLVGHSEHALFGEADGGSERQTALLATHMAARGHDVTLVVPGYSGRTKTEKGVRLRSGWDPARGVRFVRAMAYRTPELRRTLLDVGADVYYTRGFQFFTPTAVGAAHSRGALAILALTSDGDLHPSSGQYHFGIGGPVLTGLAGRLGYAWFRRTALMRADCVVTQNANQAAVCDAQHLRCRPIRSILEDPTADLIDAEQTYDALWIGNVGHKHRRSKGTEAFARLAAALPDVRFALVGNMAALEGTDVLAGLHRAPNVEFTGPLSHDGALARIASSRVVINTSPSEGFSNVMLEGWSLRKPTVSLHVDPDRLLSVGALGVCAGGDEARMASELRSLLEDSSRRYAMGTAAREYVREFHSPDSVCRDFEKLVGDLRAWRRAIA
jgi:glycosyltransferase involved in cell wall biosynthesis